MDNKILTYKIKLDTLDFKKQLSDINKQISNLSQTIKVNLMLDDSSLNNYKPQEKVKSDTFTNFLQLGELSQLENVTKEISKLSNVKPIEVVKPESVKTLETLTKNAKGFAETALAFPPMKDPFKELGYLEHYQKKYTEMFEKLTGGNYQVTGFGIFSNLDNDIVGDVEHFKSGIKEADAYLQKLIEVEKEIDKLIEREELLNAFEYPKFKKNVFPSNALQDMPNYAEYFDLLEADISHKFKPFKDLAKLTKIEFNKVTSNIAKPFSKIGDVIYKPIDAIKNVVSKVKEIENPFKKLTERFKTFKDSSQSVQKLSSGFGILKNKILGIIGAAVGLKTISESVAAASRLVEVQNIVNVVFDKSSEKINKFAESCETAYGIGKTAALNYAGTMGSVITSLGVSSDKMEDMSINLTALAGDMASFYNISDEAAFEKIRSGIMGMTRGLQQLGLNLSEATLSEFAMSKGLKQSYSDMSEANKAILRYNYLLEHTQQMTGDFSRTQGTLANQTRILALQWNSLKVSLGNVLMKILLPMVKTLNNLINGFRQLINTLGVFGKITNSQKDVYNETEDVNKNLNKMSSPIKNANKSAEKLVKTFHGLVGLDEINNLTKDTDSSDLSDELPLSDLQQLKLDDFDIDITPKVRNIDALNKLADLLDRIKELFGLFKQGFRIAFDDSSIGSIVSGLQSIKDNLLEIATDSRVVSNFNKMLDSIALGLGKITGSAASIGLYVKDLLVGGFADGLNKSKELIKTELAKIFNNIGETFNSLGNISIDLSKMLKPISSKSAKESLGNLVSAAMDMTVLLADVMSSLARDISQGLEIAFDTLQPTVTKTLQGIIDAIKPLTDGVKSLFDNLGKSIVNVYNRYISKYVIKIITTLGTLVTAILDNFNRYVNPTLQKVTKAISDLVSKHVNPLVSEILITIGKLAPLLSSIVDLLAPLASVISGVLLQALTMLNPVIKNILTAIGTVLTALQGVVKVIGDVISALTGVFEILTGLVTFDFDKILKGFYHLFESLVNIVIDVGAVFYNIGSKFLTNFWNGFKNIFGTVSKNIKSKFKDIVTIVKNTVAFKTFSAIGKNVINGFINGFTSLRNKLVSTVKNVASAIVNAFSIENIKRHFSNARVSIINAFVGMRSAIAIKFSDTWTSIKTIFAFDRVGKFFSNVVLKIQNSFKPLKSFLLSLDPSSLFGSFKSGLENVFKNVVNRMTAGFAKVINEPLSALNHMLNELRNVEILDALPFGSIIPFNAIKKIKIPKLATGGYATGSSIVNIGEAGREVVLPLERNLGWCEPLADALAKKMNNQSGTIIVKNVLDGRQISQSVIKNIRNNSRMSGTTGF